MCAYAHDFRKRPGCALIRACALIRKNTVFSNTDYNVNDTLFGPGFEICFYAKIIIFLENFPGASCSKLTTSLVNVSLKFQTLILQIHCYFLLKKCEKVILTFFQQKITVYLLH